MRRYRVSVTPVYMNRCVTRLFFTRFFAERFARIFRVVPDFYRVVTNFD